MKTQLVAMDIPDFEQASKVFRKAAKQGKIENSDLGYVSALALTVCSRGMSLNPREAEALDQAVGIIMSKTSGQ